MVQEVMEMEMDKKLIEVRRAYKRKWTREHPESVKRSQEKFYKKLLEREPKLVNIDTDKTGAGTE